MAEAKAISKSSRINGKERRTKKTAKHTLRALADTATGINFNIVVPSVAPGNVPLTFNVDGVAGTQTLYIAVGN